ncbi:MAG TPA: hypothetical protein VJ482_03055 [Acidimicrobiia bacterium]|jgi:hypothetical protein|nr:hypothetical protein [Acidimicrobiia bacterium]
MQDSKRGKHERKRRTLIEVFHLGRVAAVRRLQRLPSIVTGEGLLIGEERA